MTNEPYYDPYQDLPTKPNWEEIENIVIDKYCSHGAFRGFETNTCLGINGIYGRKALFPRNKDIKYQFYLINMDTQYSSVCKIPMVGIHPILAIKKTDPRLYAGNIMNSTKIGAQGNEFRRETEMDSGLDVKKFCGLPTEIKRFTKDNTGYQYYQAMTIYSVIHWEQRTSVEYGDGIWVKVRYIDKHIPLRKHIGSVDEITFWARIDNSMPIVEELQAQETHTFFRGEEG